MGKIVVMLVDQQEFIRTELQKAIIQGNSTEGIEIIECDPGLDGNEAVDQIDTLSPDVVLLDINFPYCDGLALCRKIVRTTPQTKVVMLTSNPAEDDDELFEVIKSGASAYLMTESCTLHEFVATIERAARGEYPINDSVSNRPEIASRVLGQFEEIVCNVRNKDGFSTPLNPKEAEILSHVVKGKANEEIGSILGISESAVKKHITSILRKLNANDRAHAVVLAVKEGMISLQPNSGISLSNTDVTIEAPTIDKESNQIIEDAMSVRYRIVSDAEAIASHIVDEAEQKGREHAGKIIAEAELEAQNNASQIIEEAIKSKSEIIANANMTAKQIIYDTEHNIENDASRIIDEVIAVADEQGSNIICEARKKAEVDAEIILDQARETAQSAGEEIKTQAKIEANKVLVETEQNAKLLIERAKNMAESEAAAIVAEAHKKAGGILQEVGNVQSNMLSNAEEEAKCRMEETRQKAEDDASKVILEAEHQASLILEESKRKAQDEGDIILEECNKGAKSAAAGIKARAEEEANKIIAEAADKSKRVVEDAEYTAKSEASAIIGEAHNKASQIIQEAGNTKSKIIADAEEEAKRVMEEAKQRGDDDAQRVIAEAEHKASKIIEQATIKQQEAAVNGNVKSSKAYDGVIELAIAPPVNVSTLCELNKQLKPNPNVDVLSIRGSVSEGLKIRMVVRNSMPIMEFVKGLSAVRDASEDTSPAQSETGDSLKRILVTTY